MSTKKQRRSQNFKDRQKKKSTRIAYLSAIIAGGVLLLVIFFVILFNAIFPPVGMEATKRKEKTQIEVFFSDAQERHLIAEKHYVYKQDNPAGQAEEVVRALLEGSKTGKVNTFPSGVTLKDIKLDKDGTAQVNFGYELVRDHPGGSSAEMATIYSLVNSLTANVPQIKTVRIIVDGKPLDSLKGHISTRDSFTADPDLLIPAAENKN